MATPELDTLTAENAALKRAVELLHSIANLLRQSLEVDAACYAMLTGVTAGVGLGFNRAMLFGVDPQDRDVLVGLMAVGPADRAEADRVWKAIEGGDADLSTLYQGGLQARQAGGALDERVRGLLVPVTSDSSIALALRRDALVQGEGTDDLGGLLHLPTGVAAPLHGPHGTRGVLYADNRFTGAALHPVLAHVFELVADHAGLALDNARHFEGASRAARTDALTGLGHHGALMEALREAVAEARPLSVVMVDLDNFKRVNDTHGHLAGDALLVGLAQRLQRHLRVGERVFRYGGEEFTLVLSGGDEAGALAAAERLRLVVASEAYLISEAVSLRATCSVGVATWQPGQSAVQVVDAADRAMFKAKQTGKNRVVVAQG